MSVKISITNEGETPKFVTINGTKLQLIEGYDFVTGVYAVDTIEQGEELINPENKDVLYYQEYCGKGIIYRNNIETELDMSFIQTQYWLVKSK